MDIFFFLFWENGGVQVKYTIRKVGKGYRRWRSQYLWCQPSWSGYVPNGLLFPRWIDKDISQIRNTMLVPLLLVTVSPFGALICSGMQLRYILCIIWLLEIFSRESSVITPSVLVNMHLCYQFARILTFSTSNDISFMKFAFLGFGFSPKFKIARFS